MDRSKVRGVGNRNRTGAKRPVTNRRRLNRRTALASRRNRRLGIRRNRNRLARAENNLRRNTRGPISRFRRFNNFNNRRNLGLRIVYVGGLPNDVDNRRLYNLFRKEGRIIGCKIVFNRMGIPKGYGFIECKLGNVFFHCLDIKNCELGDINSGNIVTYDLLYGSKGLYAKSVYKQK